jgi:hypothetical protein
MTSSIKSNALTSEDGPMWITADSVDPQYNCPVIDSESDYTMPVPHHMVSGHFEGTNKKFNFYFPLKSQWKGRFLHLVYPLIDENATDETISFGADSGAYTVQTNGGGGYPVDAAAAKFSRTVAASYYGTSERIYGYIYGGSGGSFQTIGAIENSTGVWDGAVPFIPGVPTSIPNNFFARAFARFVLEKKALQIADAVSPGGSGNPYIGLGEVERAVLDEVTKLGVPLQAWEDYTYLLGMNDPQGLMGFGGVVRTTDSDYVSDFWSKQGYLGAEQSTLGEMFRNAKIDHIATIIKVNRNEHNQPISLVLNSVPADLTTIGVEYTLYPAEGTQKVEIQAGSLDLATKVFTIGIETPESVLSVIDEGAKLMIDNRWYLALLSYHRHQVPQRPGYDAWNHLRALDGTPLYPQRPLEVGPMISLGVSGNGTHTGKIQGKVIMVANLIDTDAYPWHGDWYSARVMESLGERYDENFRLWYNDNADHIGPRTARLVQFDGILQQALRDVSAWAETGMEPFKSTQYDVVDSQIKVRKHTEEFQGIQPLVDIKANGYTRIDITSGQTITFIGKIQVSPKAGRVVSTEWDFLGTGDFTASHLGNLESGEEVKATFTYNSPGTFFPALRVTSHRVGDPNTPFARVQNLDRVRVVVH